MLTAATLLKRLVTLERGFDLGGSKAIKVFMFYPEEDVPFWDPEPPDAWQQAHPRGHAVILQVRDFGV
jgi:hypothetical protein